MARPTPSRSPGTSFSSPSCTSWARATWSACPCWCRGRCSARWPKSPGGGASRSPWRSTCDARHGSTRGGDACFRLAGAVEPQLYDHVVRIVVGSEALVAAHARPLPLVGEAAEGPLPGVEVADGVFDLKNVRPLHRFPACYPFGSAGRVSQHKRDAARFRIPALSF